MPVTDRSGTNTARAAAMMSALVTASILSGQLITSCTVRPVTSAAPKMLASPSPLSRA